MSSQNINKKLARVRRPRVQIDYEVEIGGASQRIEFPFVVGVLADLSGRPATPLAPFRERRFVEINRNRFDAVLAAFRPQLDLCLPNLLKTNPPLLDVTLRFRSLTDFGPDAIVLQVEPLRALLEERGASVDPAEVDRRLSAQLRAILHHPDFQRLEAAWRGLHYLVMNTETGPDLRVRVLSCSTQELRADQQRAASFDQSALFEKVHEEPFRTRCGAPFGLLVGDYEFSVDPEDVALLERIAAVAAQAHAPFVAAASPRMFGMDRFTQLTSQRDLDSIFNGVKYARWNAFRDSEDSRYAALTLPRVLARLPYGAASVPVERFNFDESINGNTHDEFLWMSAAWAYAARITDAFGHLGWVLWTRGIEGGGKVEGLPLGTFPTDDGAVAMNCSTEIAFSDGCEYQLSNRGFLPILHSKNRDFAVFMGTQSCQKAKVYDTPEATFSADLSTKINLLLCVSRFSHYLKVMVRDKIGSSMEVKDCETWLNRWIRQYLLSGPEEGDGWERRERRARKPLRHARIELREIAGRPGHSEIDAYLMPYFESEALLFPSMRLVAEIPHDTAFRPALIDRAWLHRHDSTVIRLARAIQEERAFDRLPILADALEEAGCTDERILGHCREASGRHECGCWVIDALLEEA